jgi:hypothetical protein
VAESWARLGEAGERPLRSHSYALPGPPRLGRRHVRSPRFRAIYFARPDWLKNDGYPGHNIQLLVPVLAGLGKRVFVRGTAHPGAQAGSGSVTSCMAPVWFMYGVDLLVTL